MAPSGVRKGVSRRRAHGEVIPLALRRATLSTHTTPPEPAAYPQSKRVSRATAASLCGNTLEHCTDAPLGYHTALCEGHLTVEE
ncbi:hypothetical protein LTR15_002497 [Elasticomyces elasticus]|nr:hypothetical protein LTR15_002497 [Elasticomyces elasticus]